MLMIMREEIALASARNEKRQRTASADVGVVNLGKNAKMTTMAEKPRSSSVRDVSEADIDAMNKSLTNLQWLCDMRLNPSAPATEAHPCVATTKQEALTRPELSYADLICLAMDGLKKDSVSLNEIYNFIMERFPYYRTAEPSWKNSIRYNLSQNKLFSKVPTPGVTKGVLWTLSAKAPRAPAASSRKGKKATQKRGKASAGPSRVIPKIEEVDDWEEIEDLCDEREGAEAAADGAAAGASQDGSEEDWGAHPWAETTPAASEPHVDANMAASLASCLSIWPLSATALAAESLNAGMVMDFSINGSSTVDLSRSLFDVINTQDEGPVPRDWL